MLAFFNDRYPVSMSGAGSCCRRFINYLLSIFFVWGIFFELKNFLRIKFLILISWFENFFDLKIFFWICNFLYQLFNFEIFFKLENFLLTSNFRRLFFWLRIFFFKIFSRHQTFHIFFFNWKILVYFVLIFSLWSFSLEKISQDIKFCRLFF